MGKVDQFEIVAHRGAPGEAPENTIQAFQRAIDLGADAAELDVRLTSDHIPLVYHYYYLDAITKLSGPIFNYTAHQIQGNGFPAQGEFTISTLSEVLESFGSKTGFEIELKGPEKESSEIVGRILHDFKSLWGTIEVTSYEPVLLLEITRHCPGLATDLLVPQSPDWMKSDVLTHTAIHRAKLAGARAVHLHPAQLSYQVAEAIRTQGIELHCWDVNDEQSLNVVRELDIPKICTDRISLAVEFRSRKAE